MKNNLHISQSNKMSSKKKRGFYLLLIAIPFMIYTFAFNYVPLMGWIYAFSDYKIGRPFWDFELVGFQQFEKMLRDKDLVRVLRNTFAMSLLGIATSPFPMFFAIMLNELRGRRVKKFVQTVTTLPNFISWIVIFGIAFPFFSSDGVVNSVLKSLGLPYPQMGLLGSVDATWFFQLGLGVWKGLGWGAIVYLAAITGIDTELYDAAKVDGANKRQLIRYITFPGLMPTYLVLLLLSVGSLLSNGFDQYFVFWNAMTAKKLEVLDYYTYKLAFSSRQYSYSIAVGMMQSVIGIVLMSIVNWISKKVRGTSIF